MDMKPDLLKALLGTATCVDFIRELAVLDCQLVFSLEKETLLLKMARKILLARIKSQPKEAVRITCSN